MTAPTRRLLVRSMVEKGLSERRALVVARMSASAVRYEPRPDHNVELREQAGALAGIVRVHVAKLGSNLPGRPAIQHQVITDELRALTALDHRPRWRCALQRLAGPPCGSGSKGCAPSAWRWIACSCHTGSRSGQRRVLPRSNGCNAWTC